MKKQEFIVLVLIFTMFNCKQEKQKPGCMDGGATNYDKDATIKVSTCIYPWILRNTSFEQGLDPWLPSVSPSGFLVTDKQDGIMPTDGSYYLRLTNNNKSYLQIGGLFWDYNYHFKGVIFDYRIIAKLDTLNNLNVGMGLNSWQKNIYETISTLNGSRYVIIEKKDEFAVTLHGTTSYYTPPYQGISITSMATAGTVTFEIDNIRMVQD